MTVQLPVTPPLLPMLAKRVSELPPAGELSFEPKWDGFRTLVFRDGVFTVFKTLPFQSTSHACSVRSFGSGSLYDAACAPDSFCSPIHSPSGDADNPFG